MNVKLWTRRLGYGAAVLALAPSGMLLRSTSAWASRPHAPATAACTTGSPDTDHDHLPDCWELKNGLVVGAADQKTDLDQDGLKAITEYRLDVKTTRNSIFAPFDAAEDDSNDNGIEDGDQDLDGDGLTNEEEAESGTSSFNDDTDGDGITDPADDTDGDGLDNETEASSVDEDADEVGASDMQDVNGDGIADAEEDFDCDEVSNADEMNPKSDDSDGDGIVDANDDSDGDGIDNGTEQDMDEAGTTEDVMDSDVDDDGTEDGLEDSDGDGVEDGVEDGDLSEDACDVVIAGLGSIQH